MANNLWKILGEDKATDGAPGVQGGPPRDPKMLPAEKDGDAKFVAGHMHARGAPRITDIDPSTLDDKLFNASNIKRSVPLGGDNKHGHVPTGVDAKAYKSMSEGKIGATIGGVLGAVGGGAAGFALNPVAGVTAAAVGGASGAAWGNQIGDKYQEWKDSKKKAVKENTNAGEDVKAYKSMSEGRDPINDPNSDKYDPDHPTNDPKNYAAAPYAAHSVQADRETYFKRKATIKEALNNAGEDDLKQAKQVDSNSKEDMDAFDQLGPKTREVLNNKMPVKWSSAKTLDMMKQRNMDPMHPQVDSQLAAQLAQHGQTISKQLHVESLLEEVAQAVKKMPKVPYKPLARDPKCEETKTTASPGNSLIAEAVKSAKSAKPADRRTGYADDQDCEACHDRTLAFHDKALARGKAEMIHYGLLQDFGPDKSSIVSKTSAGKLTTNHDHGTGQITHSWEEAKK